MRHSFLWQNFKNFILELIFPQDILVKKLEKMTLEELRSLPQASHIEAHSIHPVFSYKSIEIKTIINQIKFKGNQKLASKIAHIMAEEIQSHIEEQGSHKSDQFILIPIPLSKERLRRRGFNQIDLIGKEIKKHIPNILYKKDILIRHTHTKPQTNTLSRKERLNNIKNCFKVLEHNLSLKSYLLLLDDVTTTGATLSEAEKTLRRAGFKNITAFTVAH